MGRTVPRWLLALCLLGSLTLPAQHARAAAAVWTVRGAHGTVYLAGSVHLLAANDATLPAAFERAYADSSLLVMEMDLGKLDAQQLASWIQQHGMLTGDTTLRAVLGEQRYARLSAAAHSLGAPMPMLDKQAPWLIGVELAQFQYLSLGYDPEQGVDKQLLRHAQAEGKPTAGLETVDEELGGLERLPRADQVRILDQTLSELKDAQSDMRVVLSAWRRGDAARLATLLSKEYREFPALYRPLVTDRNQHWLPQIEQFLREDRNTLVVVGALHLVGPGGLLQLLRQDGYQPTQLD
ncbi:MAG TPA: TraB/GumN family protein [Steroidobacteraceae bacterium]|nr:TraB/GumN family protein [Steroidobacteraceae bacterium]